ncbi:MAG: hypothetical protein RL757_2941 [Bacteroidota bacterium]|jgi:tetratricopeptide (TPR) repeat protein
MNNRQWGGAFLATAVFFFLIYLIAQNFVWDNKWSYFRFDIVAGICGLVSAYFWFVHGDKKPSDDTPPVSSPKQEVNVGTMKKGSKIVMGDNPETHYHAAAEKPIKKKLNPVSKPVEQFVGRAKELVEIEKRFTQNKTLVLMNGMGGIGKSELARKFVQTQGDNYEHVAWVMVFSDIKAAFVNDIALWNSLHIAPDAQEAIRKSGDKNAFSILMTALNNLPKTLIVIDNADDAEDLEPMLAALHYENIHFLITSRAESSGANVYHIDELAPSDALEMFYQYAPSSEKDDTTVAVILELLLHHTLLIELVARFVEYEKPNLQALLKRLQDASNTYAAFDKHVITTAQHAQGKTNMPRKERIWAYLGFVFQEMNQLSESQRNALKALTLLPPMKEMDFKLLKSLNLNSTSKTLFQRLWSNLFGEKIKKVHFNFKQSDLNHLKSIGYLSYMGEDTWRTLHPLLLKVAFDKLGVNILFAEDFVVAMGNMLWWDVTNPNDSFKKTSNQSNYGIHLINLFKNDVSKGLHQIYSSLYNISYELGEYEEAKKHILSSLEISEKLNDQILMASSEGNYGRLLERLGNYEEAKEYLINALNRDLASFGEEHSKISVRLTNLIPVFLGLEDYKAAEKYAKDTVSLSKKLFGPKHTRISIALNGLGIFYQHLKEYQKAIEVLEEALAMDIEILGENHIETATKHGNLGIMYKGLKNYKKAEEHMLIDLTFFTNTLGEEHIKVGVAKYNLAKVYIDMNKKSIAIKYFKDSYRIHVATYGNEHPRTKQIKNDIKYMKGEI